MRRGRRTVLIAGPMFDHCDFAPSPARRLLGYARHLPVSGWRAVVLAPACRCTIADHGAPRPGGVVTTDHDVIVDPADLIGMSAASEAMTGLLGDDRAYVALRPILRPTLTFRRWAEWCEASSSTTAAVMRSKMSWHLTPSFEPAEEPPRAWRTEPVPRLLSWYLRADGHQAARARMLAGVVDAVVGAVQIDAAVGSHGYAPELRAGARAARTSAVPFVAEMRDAMTRGWRPIYEAIELLRIARSVRSSDAVIHCTDVEQTRDAWWLGRRPIRTVVEHGFDPDEWREVRSRSEPDPDRFVLRFFGTLHPQRHLGRFLEGYALFLQRLADPDRARCTFEYYGLSTDLMLELAAGVPAEVRERIVIVGHVPRAEAVERMASADVLVLPTSPGLPGGRFYEYLGSRRPVLATGEDADPYVEGVLASTGAGVAARESDEVEEAIFGLWKAWRSGAAGDSDDAALEPYTRRRQARELAELLDEVVSGRADIAGGRRGQP